MVERGNMSLFEEMRPEAISRAIVVNRRGVCVSEPITRAGLLQAVPGYLPYTDVDIVSTYEKIEGTLGGSGGRLPASQTGPTLPPQLRRQDDSVCGLRLQNIMVRISCG